MYSNSQFAKLASYGSKKVRPEFARILTFDFYDGIEKGVGFYSSGEAVRFSSLADSKLRIYRAFEFTLIGGNWTPQIDDFALKAKDYERDLEQAIFSEVPISVFVGIASLNLDWVKLVSVTIDTLEFLRGTKRSEREIYLEVHRLVKADKLNPI
jgi:hypothetical protein